MVAEILNDNHPVQPQRAEVLVEVRVLASRERTQAVSHFGRRRHGSAVVLLQNERSNLGNNRVGVAYVAKGSDFHRAFICDNRARAVSVFLKMVLFEGRSIAWPR